MECNNSVHEHRIITKTLHIILNENKVTVTLEIDKTRLKACTSLMGGGNARFNSSAVGHSIVSVSGSCC